MINQPLSALSGKCNSQYHIIFIYKINQANPKKRKLILESCHRPIGDTAVNDGESKTGVQSFIKGDFLLNDLYGSQGQERTQVLLSNYLLISLKFHFTSLFYNACKELLKLQVTFHYIKLCTIYLYLLHKYINYITKGKLF